MKKGNGKGGVRKKNKGSIKSKANKYFNTRYVTEHDDKNRPHVTRLHTEVPKIDRLEKKDQPLASTIGNYNDLKDDTDIKLSPSERPAPDNVACINKARKAKGLKEITTPETVMQQRRLDYIVNSEASTYAKWSDRAKSSRDKCEMAYYSKLEHRKVSAEEYKRVAAELVGPPKPESKQVLPQAKKANGYSFATKPRTVAEVTQCNPPDSVKSEVKKGEVTKASVKWYINNVPPPEWPEIIKKCTYYVDSGYRVNNKAVLSLNKQSANDDYEALERDYQALQLELHRTKADLLEKNEEQQNTIGMLYEELAQAHDQVKLAELHSVSSGSNASQVKPPLKITELATLFKVFKSQWNDNPLNAFCRVHNVGGQLREDLRNHFNLECERRLMWSEKLRPERLFYKRLADYKPVEHSATVKEMQRIRNLRRLTREGILGFNEVIITPERSQQLREEKSFYQRLASRTGTPRWLSLLETRQLLHENMTKRSEYVHWWSCVLDLREQKEMELRKQQVMDTPVYKLLKKVKDVALMEVNPIKIKQNKAKAEAEAKAETERMSRIKREREDKLEKDLVRESILRAHTTTVSNPPKDKQEMRKQILGIVDTTDAKETGPVKTIAGGDEVMRPEIKAKREAYLKKMRDK